MRLSAWRHYLRARVQMFLRRPEAALAAYRAALAADAGCTGAAHAIAFLLAERGHYAQAETTLRQVVLAAPGNAAAWFNLGYLCERQAKTAQAIAAFNQAVSIDPKHDRAWYGLGHSQAESGNDHAAVTAFERAIQINPMAWHAWSALGRCYHRLQQPDKVHDVAAHLNCYQRRLARQLIHDTGRTDLTHLIADLRD